MQRCFNIRKAKLLSHVTSPLQKEKINIVLLSILNVLDMVEYLSCCLDANLNRKFMIMKSLKKINTTLQFLYRQNEYLNPELRR